MQHDAIGRDSFRHTETEIGPSQRLVFLKEQIVEFRARLPANGDGIFKTGGGHKGHTRTFAFEQCIGADRGAMPHFSRFARPRFA